MDEDIFTDLSVLNAKKTYLKKTTKGLQPLLLPDNKKKADNGERLRPLTTKVAVKFLLEGKLKTKVCRYCLNVTPGLSELGQIMKIGGPGAIYKVSIRDIVASFHPFKVVDDPNFPNKICQKCLDKALSAYLFTQQCERAERAMLNCFEDIYEKFEKLDPIDRPRKRGRQKLNPNHNILHAEHHKVIEYAEPIINIVNSGAESVTNEPELNELECKKCWQLLPNMESLLNHETMHPKTMWYHCRLCGKSFPKSNQLKKHYNRVHVLGKEVVPFNEKDFKCNECGHVTESFIQHLQHIEKHKFKYIMEHLLKKQMDKLCAVCFNKGTKMMDLDKMVCIHGCHPDLMGDKTLYTLLASTLPDTKSYKYKELYIPSKAQIMTISKRHDVYEKTHGMKKIQPLTHNQFKEDFILSNPIIISKCSFKTNHFFFYVFSDPEYQKDDNIANEPIDMDITETVDMYTPKPKLVEIVNISEVTDNFNTKRSDFKSDKENNEDRNSNNEPDMAKNKFVFTNPKFDNERDEKSGAYQIINVLEYNFSKQALVTEVNDELNKAAAAVNISKNTFSESDCEHTKSVRDIEIEQRSVIKPDKEKQRKDLYDTQWIFKNCTNDYFRVHDSKEAKCQFCWVFKNVGTCDCCKKPIKDDESVDNSQNKDKTEREKDMNNICAKERDNNTWQCGICLTNNNADRLTCHCCGTMKVTEYDNMKIAFGNKTFFQTNYVEINEKLRNENGDSTKNHKTFIHTNVIENNEKFENQTGNGDTKNNLNKINFIEDSTMMDCKSYSEDLIEPDDRSNINNMDIETNTTFKIISAKNDSEAMDVEDNAMSTNNTLDWNTTIFKFNIDTATIPVNNNTMKEPAIKFNIGNTTGLKPQLKKIKRVIRNIPKAYHK